MKYFELRLVPMLYASLTLHLMWFLRRYKNMPLCDFQRNESYTCNVTLSSVRSVADIHGAL